MGATCKVTDLISTFPIAAPSCAIAAMKVTVDFGTVTVNANTEFKFTLEKNTGTAFMNPQWAGTTAVF